jgi:hypothetical protein
VVSINKHIAHLDVDELRFRGLDCCQFKLIEETIRGSMYSRPMPQERLDTLDRRPDFKEIPYDEDDSYPTKDSAYRVQDAINE